MFNSSIFYLAIFVLCTYRLSMNSATSRLPLAALTLCRYCTNLSVFSDFLKIILCSTPSYSEMPMSKAFV